MVARRAPCGEPAYGVCRLLWTTRCGEPIVAMILSNPDSECARESTAAVAPANSSRSRRPRAVPAVFRVLLAGNQLEEDVADASRRRLGAADAAPDPRRARLVADPAERRRPVRCVHRWQLLVAARRRGAARGPRSLCRLATAARGLDADRSPPRAAGRARAWPRSGARTRASLTGEDHRRHHHVDPQMRR